MSAAEGDHPGVSVVVPVRDGELHIAEAIESILGQTVPPLEVIVADDGSSDGTATVVDGFGEPVVRLPGPAAGIGDALNRGVEHARGEYLAFLDADDLWLPRKLELQLAAMAEDPSPEIVFGHAEQFHSPELSEEERARIRCPPGTVPAVFKGAMIIRREAADAVGPFSNDLPPTDFVDWYSRALDAGLSMRMLPDLVVRRRLHRSNLGRSVNQDNYARVARMIIDRRRAASAGGGRSGAGGRDEHS